MKQFLEQLKATTSGKTNNLLISFGADDSVTIITTLKRTGNAPENPLKISGTIDEVAAEYFNILGEVSPAILKLESNAEEVIEATEKEVKQNQEKAKKEAEKKTRDAEAAKPKKSKEQIAADKEAEKKAAAAKKEAEKLNANKDWEMAKKCFKMKQYGLAQTSAVKAAIKFPENADIKGMIMECKIGLTSITRAEAEAQGHVAWTLVDNTTVTQQAFTNQGLKPNENFDKESPIVDHAEKIMAEEAEEANGNAENNDPHTQQDETSKDTPMAEQLDENLSDVEETVEPSDDITDDDTF